LAAVLGQNLSNLSFHSVVQDWAKTAAQSTSGATTDSSAKAQSQAPSPTTTTPTQSTKPAKKKSTANNTKASKKSSSGYWLLIFFVVCGIGGYLLGSDSKPASSKANGNSVSAPPPRAAPNNAPAQAPPPQSNPAPTVAEPLVAALQEELNRRGFNAGVVDGLRGPQTSGAISAAQSSFNMYIDGLPSEALLKALRRN
jgi:hypothetical protein